MKFLVTGGAGFIGSQLALELERAGHVVCVVDDFSSASQDNLREFRGALIHQDISRPFSIPEDLNAIFHQAAITDPRYPNDEELIEKNVGGFQRLLEHCAKKRVPLIYASTAGLYGNGTVPMEEDQPKECTTAYARSKLLMDELAELHRDKVFSVGLRYFNVFGPNEAHKGRPASMIYHLWKQMRDGKRPRIFKWGEQVRDFIYVRDVVRANLCALNGKPGIYNVGTGVGTSFNELVVILNRVMGTQLEPDYFEMPFSKDTYQGHTLASTLRAEKGLGFRAEWSLERAITNYLATLQYPHSRAGDGLE